MVCSLGWDSRIDNMIICLRCPSSKVTWSIKHQTDGIHLVTGPRPWQALEWPSDMADIYHTGCHLIQLQTFMETQSPEVVNCNPVNFPVVGRVKDYLILSYNTWRRILRGHARWDSSQVVLGLSEGQFRSMNSVCELDGCSAWSRHMGSQGLDLSNRHV